ncbi:MAG: hypothetical protein GWP91_00200 [Rhodobacterales bacterium]|nr:hypothetical protein [Rhodobacterales bacterium]
MSALLLLLALSAQADPIVDGLVDELTRSTEALELGQAGPPYFIAYDLLDVWDTSVSATLGGVVFRDSSPDRDLGVSVRVGGPELDSANFGDSWREPGFQSRQTVLGDDPIALRHTAWYITDTAYKSAIENLASRKAARARRASSDAALCFSSGEVQTATASAATAVPIATLEPIALQLSEVFLAHPNLEWSRVYASAEMGRRIHVDSLGTRVIKPVSTIVVRATARARAHDGSWITDHASWVVRGADDLAPVEEMVAKTEEMADRLETWLTTPLGEDDYVGPVLFEGNAAIELVRSLALPALSGTPASEEPPKGSRSVVFGGGDDTTAVRVKRRLLPTGFHIADDPTGDLGLASAYEYDDEGEKAQSLQLVIDGVIHTHYASRTPSKQVDVSNGHGRGDPGELITGSASWTTLSATKGLSAKKMHKVALEQAAAYGLDHYLAVRRIEDASVASGASAIRFSFNDAGGNRLPAPVIAVRMYADGREEPVRGLQFVGTDHRLLRDLIAAGTQVHTTTLLNEGRGPAYGIPTTLSSPNLLIAEVELSSGGQDGEKPPALPSPLAVR